MQASCLRYDDDDDDGDGDGDDDDMFILSSGPFPFLLPQPH